MNTQDPDDGWNPHAREFTSEADRVREELHDDPFVDDATYGRLMEEAAAADDARDLEKEVPERE